MRRSLSRGTFVVHPDADGQRADDTRAPYAQMLATGQGRLAYTSTDPAAHDGGPTAKFVSFTTIPQWQWLVGGIALDDELLATMRATRNRFPDDRRRARRGVRDAVRHRGAPRREPAARCGGTGLRTRAAGDLSVRIRDGAATRARPATTRSAGSCRRSTGSATARADRRAGAQQLRGHRARHGRHCRRQQRHRRADRDAGEQRRTDGRQHGTDHRRRAAECRARGASQCAGRGRVGRRDERRRRGAARGRDDGRHRPRDAPDRRDHRRDRRHRVPDQHPGAERGRRGARGRTRQGLRGGRGRGARARAQRGRGRRDRRAERRIVDDRRTGLPDRGGRTRHDARHRRARRPGPHADRRDQRRVARTVDRYRAGEPTSRRSATRRSRTRC